MKSVTYVSELSVTYVTVWTKCVPVREEKIKAADFYGSQLSARCELLERALPGGQKQKKQAYKIRTTET